MTTLLKPECVSKDLALEHALYLINSNLLQQALEHIDLCLADHDVYDASTRDAQQLLKPAHTFKESAPKSVSTESLVKSKQRVADYGEASTPSWMVEDMLKLVKLSSHCLTDPRIDFSLLPQPEVTGL